MRASHAVVHVHVHRRVRLCACVCVCVCVQAYKHAHMPVNILIVAHASMGRVVSMHDTLCACVDCEQLKSRTLPHTAR